MENHISIIQYLENIDKNIVFKRKSSPLRAILLLLTGVCLFIVNSQLEFVNNSFLPSLITTTGSICILFAIFTFLFRKNHYYDTVNRQKLKTVEVFFDPKEREKLIRLLENGSLTDIKSLKQSTHEELKLCIMTTKDASICFSQLSAYVPFEYINITEVRKHSASEGQMLLEVIKSAKISG